MKNPLFYLIKEGQHEKTSTLISEEQNKKTSRLVSKDRYHLISLDLSATIGKKVYSSWHIRVDEFYDRKNDFLTQYHCTASTEDESSKIHIYFSPKDKVIRCIRDKQLMEPEALSSVLETVYSIIKNLRNAQEKKRSTLEQEYSQLEQKLANLSEQCNETQNQIYIETIQDVLLVLEELQYYSQDYKGIYHFFKVVSENLNKSTNTSTNTQSGQTKLENSDPRSDLVSDLVSDEEDQVSKNSKTTTKRKNSAPDIDIHSLIQKAAVACNQVKEIYNKFLSYIRIKFKQEEEIVALLNLRNASEEVLKLFLGFDLQISTLIEKSMTSQKDVASILSLIKERNTLGKNLLARFLFNYDFDRATKLIGYLSDEWITIALNTGNAALLKFLLTYSNFPINTRTVTIGQKQWLPIQLCVDRLMQETNTNKTQVERCLSILIKFGASVLTPCGDTVALVRIIEYLSQYEAGAYELSTPITRFLNNQTRFATEIKMLPKKYFEYLSKLKNKDRRLNQLIAKIIDKKNAKNFLEPTTENFGIFPDKNDKEVIKALICALAVKTIPLDDACEKSVQSEPTFLKESENSSYQISKELENDLRQIKKLDDLLNAWIFIKKEEERVKHFLEILFWKLNQFSDLINNFFSISQSINDQLTELRELLREIYAKDNVDKSFIDQLNCTKTIELMLEKLGGKCIENYWVLPSELITPKAKEDKKDNAIFFKELEDCKNYVASLQKKHLDLDTQEEAANFFQIGTARK